MASWDKRWEEAEDVGDQLGDPPWIAGSYVDDVPTDEDPPLGVCEAPTDYSFDQWNAPSIGTCQTCGHYSAALACERCGGYVG